MDKPAIFAAVFKDFLCYKFQLEGIVTTQSLIVTPPFFSASYFADRSIMATISSIFRTKLVLFSNLKSKISNIQIKDVVLVSLSYMLLKLNRLSC